MPFPITNVYHQWNTCNSYSCAKKVMAIKPPSLWAFQVVQISQLSTMTNWISFCHTHSRQASRDCIAWQLIYEHVTDVNNRVRPRPPETTSYQALTLQKFDFSSKYISSIEVQCGESTALSTWSKWPPAIYLLVRTILHGAGLLIIIARPNLLCRTSMITPCQLGIQKLHLHWNYSGSGIYSHTVRHFPAASPSTAKRLTVESTLFTVTSSPGHVNHVTTIMTLASFTEFWNLYWPGTIRFS